jgi:hypothetical protein
MWRKSRNKRQRGKFKLKGKIQAKGGKNKANKDVCGVDFGVSWEQGKIISRREGRGEYVLGTDI